MFENLSPGQALFLRMCAVFTVVALFIQIARVVRGMFSSRVTRPFAVKALTEPCGLLTIQMKIRGPRRSLDNGKGVPEEVEAIVLEWLQARGYEVHWIRVYRP